MKIKMLMTVTPDFSFLAKPGTVLVKGETYEATVNKNGAVSGVCENGEVLGVKPHEFIKSDEEQQKNKLLNIKRVMEIMIEHEFCDNCGNGNIGLSRRFMVNEEVPGKEFIPFHIICSCGHEVKIYE